MSRDVLDKRQPLDLARANDARERVARALRRAAHQARAPASVFASGGAGFRARKGDKAFRIGLIVSFVLLVLAPILVESVYWGLWASKQYESEIKFTVRAGESSPLDSLGGLFGLSGSAQAQDAQIISKYISSRSMIETLDASLDLRKIYGRPEADYFSRFTRDTIEDLERYMKNRIDVNIETISGIITVSVRAFRPEDAVAIGDKVIALSETLVNELSQRARKDALAQSQLELERAQARLQRASAEMRDARDAQGVLDASAAGEALNKIVSALRLQLASAEQDLAAQGPGMQNSPTAGVTRARIASIQRQIADYSSQIAGLSAGKATMADNLALLSRKQVDLSVAQQQYVQASAAFENARVALETQTTYLTTFVRPLPAEKSTYPHRWWEWSRIVFPCLLVWAILVGLAFLVRDNMAK
jgi:capsular polysaccharide transport system permease protein